MDGHRRPRLTPGEAHGPEHGDVAPVSGDGDEQHVRDGRGDEREQPDEEQNGHQADPAEPDHAVSIGRLEGVVAPECLLDGIEGAQLIGTVRVADHDDLQAR